MLPEAVTFVEHAATASGFIRYCIVPVQVLNPDAQDTNERDMPVAVLIDYNPNGIAPTLTNPLKEFLRIVHGRDSPVRAMIGTIVDQDCYYVMLQAHDSTPPSIDSRRAASNGHPATLSPRVNGANGKVRMTLQDIIATMPTIDSWLKQPEVHDQLAHDDDELKDYEYCTENPEHPEMYMYTYSQSHNFHGRYIVTFGKDKKPESLTEVNDSDCKSCMAEHNDLVREGRQGW